MKSKDYYLGLLKELKDEALAQGGIQTLARKTKLHRVNLNRILSEKGNPELQSLSSIFQEMGFRLRVEAASGRRHLLRPRNKSSAKGLGLPSKKGPRKALPSK
jgi:DNA-binding phage protein